MAKNTRLVILYQGKVINGEAHTTNANNALQLFMYLNINGVIKDNYYQPIVNSSINFSAGIDNDFDIYLAAGTVIKIQCNTIPIIGSGFITGHLISE